MENIVEHELIDILFEKYSDNYGMYGERTMRKVDLGRFLFELGVNIGGDNVDVCDGICLEDYDNKHIIMRQNGHSIVIYGEGKFIGLRKYLGVNKIVSFEESVVVKISRDLGIELKILPHRDHFHNPNYINDGGGVYLGILDGNGSFREWEDKEIADLVEYFEFLQQKKFGI